MMDQKQQFMIISWPGFFSDILSGSSGGHPTWQPLLRSSFECSRLVEVVSLVDSDSIEIVCDILVAGIGTTFLDKNPQIIEFLDSKYVLYVEKLLIREIQLIMKENNPKLTPKCQFIRRTLKA